ncbi:hypothetical protein F4859DRAFT_444362 [Xylaria cf. heliscus]|nr:hypothetical protein F4859DRAFT_444362 [Xylaria cf. heliscus]
MNWTEGSLARHARGTRGRQRNALIARQKQHFANARSNLLCGRAKQGPVKISFLASESSPELPRQVPLPRNRHNGPPSPFKLIKQEPGMGYPKYHRDENHEVLPTNFDRRKRLLEKSDWAGLGLQKPLDISFPGQVYATRRWTRVARPPERTPNEPRKHTVSCGGERYEPLKRSSMRIQIGSQEVRPSVGTGSQSSTQRCTLELKRQACMPRHDLVSENGHHVNASEPQGYGYASIAADDNPRVSLAQIDGPDTPVNVVYSSSVIHEPAPRRSSDFHVLQWSPSSSEDRGSMQVEIGQPIRPVPPSQESGQKKWKNWVFDNDTSNHPSDSPLPVMDAAEIHTEQSRSSVLALPSYLQPRLPSLHLSSETDLAPTTELSECISTGNITGSHDIPQDTQCPLERHDLLPSTRQCRTPKRPDNQDDLNNAWMKFAFSDEDGSEELLMNAFTEAAHQAAVELRPSDTSGSIDEYTENTATCITELSSICHGSECDATSYEYSSESHMATKGTTGSETASSNIATVGPAKELPRNSTRFIMPKAFIGKYSKTDEASITRHSVANIPIGGRKGRRKRRKIVADGRPDIRNMPNFEGDPIEEIDDD